MTDSDVDVRFLGERIGHTETICDNCHEGILESEDRYVVEVEGGQIWCDDCKEQNEAIKPNRTLRKVNRSALTKLPWVCAHRLPTTGETILILRGEDGYIPTTGQVIDPDRFNQVLGINAYQAEAMQAGSIYGWGVPGCDPDGYREEGLTPVLGSFTQLERVEKSDG